VIHELWQAHLTFALLAFLILPNFGLSPSRQCLLLLGLLAIGAIPVAGLPLAAYLRSFTDDLAITTLVALLFATLLRLRMVAGLGDVQREQILLLFAILALFLYPATLGLTLLDPYRLGYSPRALLLVIGALALLLLWLRNGVAAIMLGAATLAFSLELKPSTNYWDYLLDPLLALYCWVAVLSKTAAALFGHLRKQRPTMRSE